MDTAAQTASLPVHEEFFAGNGEMAALMRSLDWSQTPLGPTAAWPQSLKTTVRILLTSRYAMWMGWGADLTFLYNDAYRQDTLGVKHPWALGATAREVWAEIWSDIGPRIEKVLHAGEATWDKALMLFLERSGYPEETYHTFSYSPLSDDAGRISGMLCVVTEETERVIGERRLALLREVAAALVSAQSIEEVFAAIAGCIEADPRDLPFTLAYLFDPQGDCARLVSATGVPAGHPLAAPVIGQEADDTPWPLSALLTGRQPIIVGDLAQQFQTLPSGPWDKPPGQAILVPIAQQGQERPAGFLVTAINPYRKFDADYQGFIHLLAGQIASSLANARAYEAERKRAEALAELDRAKTAFFSNISHEFRTPLTLMLGPMEDALALPESDIAPEGRASLSVAYRNGQRLLKLVNTLLDFTRIEAGRVQANYDPTDLAAFTADLASVFRSAVEKAGMRLLADCPPLSELAYVDRDMWEKIVLNLLSNAFKFTLEGEIAVTLREEAGTALLSVRDTGAGIPPEQMPHIFERFHRIEGMRARAHEGTGIGLALVQELVKLHGGTVAVASVVGAGTTFTVAIPLGKAHLPPERISTPSALASTALRADSYVEEALRWLPDADFRLPMADLGLEPNGEAAKNSQSESENRKAKILLADDNADMRDYVQRLLNPHYKVIAVADGEEALQAARQERPDLVLSDVMMPNLDGFGLLEALRSDPRAAGVPVIILSARAGEEARIEGMAAGADDYLTKPFSARELRARVAACLELARVRREAEQRVQALNARLQRAMTETHHRVKNNLQLISALIELQKPEDADTIPAAEFDRLGANVRALGVIHDLLTQEAKAGADQETLSSRAALEKLTDVLRQTMAGRALKADLDDARLSSRQATGLALVTNELVANALKHGSGEIQIRLEVSDGEAALTVRDDGPGFPAGFDAATTASTGLELIENIVRWDLSGKIAYESVPQGGAQIQVTFPVLNLHAGKG